MDAMLLATTNFARLLLGSIFLANLALWIFRYSPAGQIGVLAMVLAMVAAWYSQSQYFAAAQYEQVPDQHMELMRAGNLARWSCVVLTGCACLCLVFG